MGKVQAYIEDLTIMQGEGAGESFKVLPWQDRFINEGFSARGEAALSIARGNGKTTLVAALACAALDGPLAQPYAQVIIVAPSFNQGMICFRHAKAFIETKQLQFGSSPRDWRIRESSNIAEIEYKPTGVLLKVLGSNPRFAHGLAPSLALIDELAQWPPYHIDRMLSSIQTARGKIPNSRVIYLGTRAATPEHAFEREIKLAAYSQIHACDREDDNFAISSWNRANPSLQHMPSLHAMISQEAERARKDPARLASFEALRLNKGVPDHIEAVLITAQTWLNAEIEDVEINEGYILGVDMGSSAAMTAAAAYDPRTKHLDAFAVFPNEPNLINRGYADGVDALYTQCHARGEIIQAGHYVSDPVGMLREVKARWGFPAQIVCDAWREAELRQALEEIEYPPEIELTIRRMGFFDGGEDVRLFTNAILDSHCVPKRNLLLRSAVAGARVVSDSAGNSKLAKGGEGRRARTRDDAVAAAILAVGAGRRQSRGPVETIPYVVI